MSRRRRKFFCAQSAADLRTNFETHRSKTNNMKTKRLFTIAAVSAGLAFGAAAYGHEKGEKEESINSSDVPQAVQQAADKQLKGASIVRWEKEGSNYEAVVSKDGKEWGYKFDANGKMLGKHSESAEHKEKGEKY
jgi:hypothetical protein